jgi:cholesterol transport system auxiliary component
MRTAIAAVTCALLGGCLPTGPSLPPQQFYVLTDLAKPGTAERTAKPGRSLLISPTVTSPFYDTQSLVFSRAAGQRSYYQFAGWTERPGRRFSELLTRRLETRGAFVSVASTTSGVKGDLILSTRLEEIYQDASASPGRVQVEVTAELIDLVELTMISRRRFSQSAATTGENAAAAVGAFNQAVTALLDEVAAWTETAAARPAAR